MRVTPYLGNNNIISLEIEQEISAIASTNLTGDNTSQVAGPTTTKSTTTTRVHVPDGFFVVISGMIRDEYIKQDTQVPCLGGVPLLGAAFKNKDWADTKRNYMIFLRPQIIQTGEDMQRLTKHQQDVYKAKNKLKTELLLSTEDALEFLNLKKSDNADVDQAFEMYDGDLGYMDLNLPGIEIYVLPETDFMTTATDLRVNSCHASYYYFA
jgi:type III secretion protein C